MISFGLFVSVWSLVMGWKVDQGRYGEEESETDYTVRRGEERRGERQR